VLGPAEWDSGRRLAIVVSQIGTRGRELAANEHLTGTLVHGAGRELTAMMRRKDALAQRGFGLTAAKKIAIVATIDLRSRNTACAQIRSLLGEKASAALAAQTSRSCAAEARNPSDRRKKGFE